jgi:CHAT domain-containing protein
MKLGELRDRIDDEYPLFSSMKYNVKKITIKDIRAAISPGESVIEYVLADTSLFIFVVGRAYAECFAINIDSLFYASIDKVNKVVSSNPDIQYRPTDFKDFVSGSNLLYEKLISPISKVLQGDKLLIVPDAELNFISFDILLQDSMHQANDDYKDLGYLINDYTIKYSYSLSLANEDMIPAASVTDPRVIAFAPDYGEKGEPRSDLTMRREELFPLPYAVDEVKNVLNYYPGRSYLGSEANEDSFIQEAPKYEIIHLAMHTLIDNENPLFSKLVFTSVDDSLREGYLNIYELYNLELGSRLAVLSACNTGTGKLEKGEGVMSLARAFMYSGIPSIVMTLWTVEDRSGSTIMSNFYKHLKEGNPKDAALRSSKLEYLQTAGRIKSHPYYWGGYVCIGDPSPLEASGINITFIISAVLAILAVSVFFLYMYKRKQRNADKII